MSASNGPREWDAGTYHAVATPHQSWGAEILDRLTLRGDETVLDLGCGTGRVSAQLLERLGPEGHVIGIDGSAAMVAEAQRQLGGERARFVQQDLLELTVEEPADAAVSSATFHWIADHDRLFARIRTALKDGAPFVAQCGGYGNIASIVAVVEEVIAREPFAPAFAGWPGPWNYASPEETVPRLERAGFAVDRVWLNESPQRPPQTREFLRTVSLGGHLLRLTPELQEAFLDAIVEGLGPEPVHDYVRLNIVATAR
ncbi:MAG: methyltransferase domain-containing protein [Baekduia sp.]